MAQNGDGMVADITISHGHFVDEVATVLGSSQPGWCEFCAITSYKITKKEESADGTTNPVATTTSTTTPAEKVEVSVI